MKALKATVLFSIVIFFLSSCSNEFEVIDTWKDIPVVYGLLNNQDSVQYIRVEKAFLDADANALELAKVPDSLYYKNISVTLENVDNPSENYLLEKVDGNVENVPRDEGVFANTPNYLYKLALGAEKLSGENIYRLTLDRGDNQEPVTAETSIITDVELKTPNEDRLLKIPTDRETRIRWSNDPEVAFYTLKFQIYYLEEYTDSPTVLKTLTWTVDDYIKSENDPEDPSNNESAISYEFQGDLFYQFLANNIDVALEVSRVFLNIDITIIAGGHELQKYIDVGKVNTGLTSSQFTPTYSNLSEGFGVLSTNFSYAKNKGVDSETMTNIKESEWTTDLNFQ